MLECPGCRRTDEGGEIRADFSVDETGHRGGLWDLEVKVKGWRLAGERGQRSAWVTRLALALFHMFEDAGDNLRLGHLSNDSQMPGASGAGREVDVEPSVEPSHPPHRCGGGSGCGVTSLGTVTAAVLGHDEVTVAGI